MSASIVGASAGGAPEACAAMRHRTTRGVNSPSARRPGQISVGRCPPVSHDHGSFREPERRRSLVRAGHGLKSAVLGQGGPARPRWRDRGRRERPPRTGRRNLASLRMSHHQVSVGRSLRYSVGAVVDIHEIMLPFVALIFGLNRPGEAPP
jgi:hypothetical protein